MEDAYWTPIKEIGTRDLLREVQRRHPRGCVFVGIQSDGCDGEDAFLTYENRFAARDLCRLALAAIRESLDTRETDAT